MSDTKLFRLDTSGVKELSVQSVTVEKSLQTLMESNLEAFLGVRFLASEHVTGKKHGGRIDTLGIDENDCPVIIEYKRALNENVITQGLFYLDWLMDHQAEFNLLAASKLGQTVSIEWKAPRLICIAGDYNKYDEHAVLQIDRNIELIRYRRYEDDLLLLELVNPKSTSKVANNSVSITHPASTTQIPMVTSDLFESLKSMLMALGDDVQMNTLKHYFAFKRMKNFACVEIQPNSGKVVVYVKVNPDTVTLENGFTSDMRKTGHYGTGDLRIRISSETDLKKAEPLLIRSYEAS